MMSGRGGGACLALAVAVVACSSDESSPGVTGSGSGAGPGGGGTTGEGGQAGASLTGGSGQGGAGQGGTGGAGGATSLRLPPVNGQLDYQLGGAYPPPAGVAVLSRDRSASPAPGLYNICYLNGFQAQPDEDGWWLSEHPDLILRDGNGDPVIDTDWDEMLLDVSTAAKRAALAAVVGDWISQCGSDGFDAVEIDNLDSYSRSQGLLSENDAVAYMALLSEAAHARGLAIAQKNSTELLPRRSEMGTDFAVAEECNRWSECNDYVSVYGSSVFVIEYRQQDFDQGCAGYPDLSIVLRDLDLVTPSSSAYVYDAC